jgi:hypothetical protein
MWHIPAEVQKKATYNLLHNVNFMSTSEILECLRLGADLHKTLVCGKTEMNITEIILGRCDTIHRNNYLSTIARLRILDRYCIPRTIDRQLLMIMKSWVMNKKEWPIPYNDVIFFRYFLDTCEPAT